MKANCSAFAHLITMCQSKYSDNTYTVQIMNITLGGGCYK